MINSLDQSFYLNNYKIIYRVKLGCVEKHEGNHNWRGSWWAFHRIKY